MAKGKATPTKIKELQGTREKSREMKNEMTPEVKESLSHEGLVNTFADKIWIKLNINLSAIGMLNEIDQELLMAYCNQMGIYFDCMDKVKMEGYLMDSVANGKIVSNYMKIGNDALKVSITLSDKFGFNPAARTKIEMPTQKKGDIMDDII